MELILSDEELDKVKNATCKKYKVTWAELVDGDLSSADLEQAIIDIADNVALASQEATLKKVGEYIKNNGEQTDYSGEKYNGVAWILFPDDIEALKRGKFPEGG